MSQAIQGRLGAAALGNFIMIVRIIYIMSNHQKADFEAYAYDDTDTHHVVSVQHTGETGTSQTSTRSKMRPIANFPCSPDDLYRAVCFGDIEQMAAELGVTAQQLAYWRRGREPVPKAVYLWLNHKSDTALGSQFGPFRGFRLSQHGDALECPATGVRIPYDEIAMLPEYRRLNRLVTQQTELIETLMTERDFYRSNCHQQARAGWLINQIFPLDRKK
ncbi:hypothetical protein [Chromobacterium sp. ASV23]|uniref:hypothetical protein n=1 Tax=Chromobacterium sp. ASV23 TaxID=2795110 RepID=UPI0018ECD917|nr:hypothetical protein [Chromobacterium sp. ASV23]